MRYVGFGCSPCYVCRMDVGRKRVGVKSFFLDVVSCMTVAYYRAADVEGIDSRERHVRCHCLCAPYNIRFRVEYDIVYYMIVMLDERWDWVNRYIGEKQLRFIRCALSLVWILGAMYVKGVGNFDP